MRFHCKAAAGLMAVLAVASVALAQFPFGGGRGNDLMSLLNNPQIRKELAITDEQSEKIPDAVIDALAKVLDSKQAKRLREIQLQQMGNRAFLEAKVQKELKITDSQADSIKTLLADSNKEIAALFKGGFRFGKGDEAKEAREKLAAARKEVSEKVMAVLNSDQRNAYKQLVGEEFKLEPPTGFGKGKGGFGKRKAEKTE